MRVTVAMLCLLLVGLGCAAGADPQEINGLRQEDRRLQAQLDSLGALRDSVASSAGSLSARIDSLKDGTGDENAGQLQAALRSSLALGRRLGAIDRGLEATRVRQSHLRERLRTAFDWEIAQLIRHLDQHPDQGLLAQLMVYQEERERLGVDAVEGELRYSAEMAINPSDGPDEIRQKMELMEGIAARLAAEQQRADAQLARLEEEQRLRRRVRVFASEMALFDEHLPAGRVLSRAAPSAPAHNDGYLEPNDARAEGPVGITPPTDADGDGHPALVTVSGSLEAVREGEPRALGLGGAEDVALEIQKLRAHQQEVRQLEVLARERAASFRTCLDQMLEGSD